ncbi:MASE1 domain-containing protein [Achromobacter xylosoxidans]
MGQPDTRPRQPLCLLWAIPYLLCAAFSHLFNDPVSHASFVWLPSGVAVGAYLLTARRHWPMLMAGLFCAQLILSFLWRGQAATALVFAITAALSSLLAAWTVQRLTPREGDVSFVAALLAGAVAGAASSALLGGGWLWLAHEAHALLRLRNWVSSYLAGVLIMTPALLGLAHFRPRRSGGPRARDLALGAVAYALLIGATFMTFDGDMIRNLPYVVTFELTYLPLVFAVLVALVWGPLGGSLAVVTLAFMVLYQSGQGEGPFVAPDNPWQALLATQAYLAITALLILLVNTLRSARAQSLERAEQWRGRFELALAGSHQLMYRYNPQDGSLELAGDVQAALGAPSRCDARPGRAAGARPSGRPIAPVPALGRAPRRHAGHDAAAVPASAWRGRLAADQRQGSPLADFDGSVAVVAGMWRLGEMEPGTGDVR